MMKPLGKTGFAMSTAEDKLPAPQAAQNAPSSLVTSLGKLSLSGVPMAPKLAAASTGIVTGVSVMKIGIVSAIVVVAVVTGGVVMQRVMADAPAKVAVDVPPPAAAPAPNPAPAALADLDFPPCVVKTVPANREKDVDVNLQEIKVTFDRPMTTENAWSWIMHSDLGVYPGYRGSAGPRWEDNGKTCALPVKLSPDTIYAVGANSVRNHGFKDTEGKDSVPYVWLFKTKKAQ